MKISEYGFNQKYAYPVGSKGIATLEGTVSLAVSDGSGQYQVEWTDGTHVVEAAVTVVPDGDQAKIIYAIKLEEAGGTNGHINYTVTDSTDPTQVVNGTIYYSFEVEFIEVVGDDTEANEEQEVEVPARIRIRNPQNSGWLDLCNSEMYARDVRLQRWVRMYPGKTYVRSADNSYWELVDCGYDPAFDEPCTQSISGDGGSCSGQPGDPFAGSGNGIGSDGPVFDIERGYPAGYDMPDAGQGGFGMSSSPRSRLTPLGLQVWRPSLQLFDSYDSEGASASDFKSGRYDVPNALGASLWGRKSVITESVYEVGPKAGYFAITYAAYDAISIDVYYLGVRRATTCGQVPEKTRGMLNFYVNPFEGGGDERILVRVRGPSSARWAIQLIGPFSYPVYQDFDPNNGQHYSTIDAVLYDSAIMNNIELLGGPGFPAPCHATVGNWNREQQWMFYDRVAEKNFFEYYHYLGLEEGFITIDYTLWDTEDYIEVYYDGTKIATSFSAQTGKGQLRFLYKPNGHCTDVVVRVVTKQRSFGEDLGTWYYTMYCQNAIGHRTALHPCDDNQIFSMGHPATDDYFDIDNGVEEGIVRIEVRNASAPIQVSVFDKDSDNLIIRQSGQGNFGVEFMNFNREGPAYREIYVRVEGGIGTGWEYIVHCPVPLLDIEIGDDVIDEPEPPPPEADAGPYGWDCEWTDLESKASTMNFPWKFDTEYAIYVVDTHEANFLSVKTCGLSRRAADDMGSFKSFYTPVFKNRAEFIAGSDLDDEDARSVSMLTDIGRSSIIKIMSRPMEIVPFGSRTEPHQWEYTDFIVDGIPRNRVNADIQKSVEHYIFVMDQNGHMYVSQMNIAEGLTNYTQYIAQQIQKDTHWIRYDIPSKDLASSIGSFKLIGMLSRPVDLVHPMEFLHRDDLNQYENVWNKPPANGFTNKDIKPADAEFQVGLLDPEGGNEMSGGCLPIPSDLFNCQQVDWYNAGIMVAPGPDSRMMVVTSAYKHGGPGVVAHNGYINTIFRKRLLMGKLCGGSGYISEIPWDRDHVAFDYTSAQPSLEGAYLHVVLNKDVIKNADGEFEVIDKPGNLWVFRTNDANARMVRGTIVGYGQTYRVAEFDPDPDYQYKFEWQRVAQVGNAVVPTETNGTQNEPVAVPQPPRYEAYEGLVFGVRNLISSRSAAEWALTLTCVNPNTNSGVRLKNLRLTTTLPGN